MSRGHIIKGLAGILLFLVVTVPGAWSSIQTKYEFKPINIDEVSRYREDRIAFQHIQKEVDERTDNSLGALLVIKDRQMYLLKDGYDNPGDVMTRRRILEQERRLIEDSLWKNTINNKPDRLIITDRREVSLEKNEEQFVDSEFGDFYRDVRNKFIKKHVNIFYKLMTDRTNSDLNTTRKPIPKHIWDDGETKYFTSVTAKTIDEKIYYAEDADGDGITETFTVNIGDGFHWGYKSGPNIIFIYNIDKNDENSKEVQDLIKDLTKYAFAGTPEAMKAIKEYFPEEKTINQMIDDLYRIKD
jgi:hypothetical protein